MLQDPDYTEKAICVTDNNSFKWLNGKWNTLFLRFYDSYYILRIYLHDTKVILFSKSIDYSIYTNKKLEPLWLHDH